MAAVVIVFFFLLPFHVACVGLLALLCQDAFTKKRVTIRSLFALTSIASFELAMIRLVTTFVGQ